MTKKELAKYIDHTYLKEMTRKDVNRMIEEAKKSLVTTIKVIYSCFDTNLTLAFRM